MIKKEDLVIREKNAEDMVADATTMDIETIIERMLNNTGVVDEIYLKFPRTCLREVLEVLEHDSFLTRNLNDINFSLNTYPTHVSITFTR